MYKCSDRVDANIMYYIDSIGVKCVPIYTYEYTTFHRVCIDVDILVIEWHILQMYTGARALSIGKILVGWEK